MALGLEEWQRRWGGVCRLGCAGVERVAFAPGLDVEVGEDSGGGGW